MTALIEWKGKIFNGYEILEPLDKNKIKSLDMWKIKCICGNIFNNKPSMVKKDKGVSCGCKHKAAARANGKLCKRYNYFNYKNHETNIIILKPLDPLKEGCNDHWICLCQRHEKPVEFITTAYHILRGYTKSCGCLNRENFAKQKKIYWQKKRELKGLDKNKNMTQETMLIRVMIFNPIRRLIMELDSYTCCLCLDATGGNLHVHHIQPIQNTFTFKEMKNYTHIYEINNLITLCKKCHKELAHEKDPTYINPEIQEELKVMASMRPLSRIIKEEYNRIVKEQIEPWLDNYLKQYQ